jgi:lipopolysaccharide biosynthesis glycosyltransferase
MVKSNTQTARTIVMACDEAYAMPLATALRSIADANRHGQSLEAYILVNDFSEDTRAKVLKSIPQGSISLHWIPIDMAAFENFVADRHVSKMTYARLLIPSMLPRSVSRALYIDVDTLILDDLSELWESELEGALVGAVLDDLDQRIRFDSPGLESVPRVRNYFNAGILLIDLDRWRSEKIAEKALAYLAGNPRTMFWDQDALNVVCDGRWKRLDGKWNFQDLAGRLDGNEVEFASLSTERVAIAHFASNLKPWLAWVLSPNADFYDSFRSRTCFARSPRLKFFDFRQRAWSHTKRFLRRFALVRAIRAHVKQIGAQPSN